MPTSRSFGAVARLAASQHGVVTRSQAASFDISRHTARQWLNRGLWTEPASGLFVVTSVAPSWQQHVMLATLALGGVPVASHATAARLHGLDGFDAEARVMVTVPPGRRVVVPGVEVHRTGRSILSGDRIVIEGIGCTSMARTLVDLGATESGAALERAMDDFERRGLSLTWLETTARQLHRPGQRGTNLVLAQVAQRRARLGRVRGSWFQKVVAECLRSPLLPGLVEEYEIRDEHGKFVARADLAIPLVRLGIEAHSRQYHVGPRAEAYDEHRDNRAGEAGWDLRYIGYAAAHQTPKQVRAFIERLVARRARDLGVTLCLK